MKKSNVKWVGPNIAKKWPEGSVVLVSQAIPGVSRARSAEVRHYFRPDWVARGVGGYGPNCKFFLLETA